ncbi:hypothetical protein WH8501_11395 [Crocosphaera watsonii WH 8501]|uniref:hypothetical protein n=1 Tax=Crocosphaera watsonii TaxID=263511 RepID=UPI000039CB26|nr:hypothetical protein [Crocosphaera watsonii]
MTQAQQDKKKLQEKLRNLNQINQKLIVCKTLKELTTEALKQIRHYLNVQLVQLGESNPPDFYRNFRDQPRQCVSMKLTEESRS